MRHTALLFRHCWTLKRRQWCPVVGTCLSTEWHLDAQLRKAKGPPAQLPNFLVVVIEVIMARNYVVWPEVSGIEARWCPSKQHQHFVLHSTGHEVQSWLSGGFGASPQKRVRCLKIGYGRAVLIHFWFILSRTPFPLSYVVYLQLINWGKVLEKLRVSQQIPHI